MEKSLLSFATTYPGWDPGAAAKQLLGALRAPHPPPGAANAAAAGGSQWRDGVTAYQPHYPFTKHLSESLNNTGVLHCSVEGKVVRLVTNTLAVGALLMPARSGFALM